jgi:hypothetical protein
MSEIKRPASVRELLDCLPRLTLTYVCEQRGLAVSRANDDCRSSIARSFRGQRDALLAMLRKDELELLLQFPIRDGDQVFAIPETDRYNRRQLLELAMIGFGRTKDLGEPFFVVDATDDSVPPPSSEPETSEMPEDEGPLAPESQEAVSSAVGSGWSRPRPIRRLLSHFGLPVHEALSQDDFSALVEALENRGYEVATMAGERLTPLHDTVGIDAEVRLRHDALAVPAASLRGEATGQGDHAAANAHELGDYARAALRLELLTAGFGGDASDKLVADCVEISAAGLPLDATTRELLGRVARMIMRTRRDPVTVLMGLVQRLDREDGEVLLREYVALHRPGDDMSSLLFAHWAALSGTGAPSEGGATERPAALVDAADVQ